MQDTLNIGWITWTHISGFDSEWINEISEKYDLHELIVDDLEELNTQDKIDMIEWHISIVFHFPKYDKTSQSYLSNEFNIILWKDYIITVTRYDSNHILNIRNSYKKEIEDVEYDEKYKITPYYILYKILDVMYDKTAKLLQNVSRDITEMERKIFLPNNNSDSKLLEQLVVKKHNLVFLRHNFEAQTEVLEEIPEALPKFYEKDLDVYFDDILSRNSKIIRNTSMIYENLISLVDAYNTIMNMKTSNVILVLTIFTALHIPISLLAGMFWMNVPVPFMDNPYWFWIVTAIMLIIVAAIWIIFRKKWYW